MTKSTWKILKLDWKTPEKLLDFFLAKEWKPCTVAFLGTLYTVSQKKNDSDVAHYNFNAH